MPTDPPPTRELADFPIDRIDAAPDDLRRERDAYRFAAESLAAAFLTMAVMDEGGTGRTDRAFLAPHADRVWEFAHLVCQAQPGCARAAAALAGMLAERFTRSATAEPVAVRPSGRAVGRDRDGANAPAGNEH